jgi:hypothetical protein
VRVEVTQQDISEGAPQNCYLCPVVQAVMRAAQARTIIFSSKSCLIYTGDQRDKGWARVELSPAASEFIARFDHGEPCVPFAFELDFPSCEPAAGELPSS